MTFAPLVWAIACARTEHTPVDRQLDVAAAVPDDAESVRICVTDGPARTFGAGDGRYALTGLTPDVAPEVTVDVLGAGDVVLARVTPLVLDEVYATAELAPCDGCAPCIGGGGPATDAWVLGVRFVP